LRDGRIDLPTALASAKAIDGSQFNRQIALKALSYFGEGSLLRLSKSIKSRLVKAAREVDLDRLPTIEREAQSPEADCGPLR
jgi:hypothetical protein